MTCHDLRDFLAGYESGELAPAQEEFVALHLEGCPACRQSLADLRLTRRQLEGLRLERWQPDLSARVARRLGRRVFVIGLGRWALRFGVAVVFLALVFGLPGGSGPAAPPAATVYVSGDEGLTALATGTGSVRELGALAGRRFLGVAADGRTGWWLRDVEGLAFAVDQVDLTTGELAADPAPKPGRAYGGALSPDGKSAYVVAAVQGVTYLKRVDLVTRFREDAWSLGDFPPEAAVLPRGDRVYLAAADRLATVTADGAVSVRPVPGLTPVAALDAGGRLVSARTGGGLLLVEPGSGRVTGRMAGPVYEALATGPGGALYGAAGTLLEVRAGRRLTVVQRLPLPARAAGLVIK